MKSVIRSFFGDIVSTFFCGYNAQLEEHKNRKILTTFVIGETCFEGLFLIDYDKNFLVLSDEEGVIVNYNRNDLKSFGETTYKESTESNDA